MKKGGRKSMYDYKLTKLVNRKAKPMTSVLRKSMIIFSVIFIVLGIFISQSFMLPGALLVLLYFFYDVRSDRSYEYTMEGDEFSVAVILGKRRRKQEQELNLQYMEVLAPHWHEAVEKYRKDGGNIKLPKYDYTSYEPEIEYYTMIIENGQRKIKLLLDLDEDMLRILKQKFPKKVFLDKNLTTSNEKLVNNFE